MEILGFYIYAAIFRLAIIFVGGLALYWGFKLFIVNPSHGGESSEISAELAGNKISIKHAAPGTFFVLFGTFVIGLMLYQGNPEYVKTTVPKAETANTQESFGSQTMVKSDNSSFNSTAFRERLNGAFLEYRVNPDKARTMLLALLHDPELPVGEASSVFHALAEDALATNDHDRALTYASLATGIQPEKSSYAKTLQTASRHAENHETIHQLINALEYKNKRSTVNALKNRITLIPRQ